MDTRGIEVTNQLRSAIRAKLMELGIRYDEELPDYILVMVVNKKSREQMHEDLYLFLEDSTASFVDWLHNQVLKKLQKVTVAKKKSSREFVPTVIVKQEEEKKKRKMCTTSFLEDQAVDTSVEKSLNENVKEDKLVQKQQMVKSVSNQILEQSHNKNMEKNSRNVHSKNKTDETVNYSNNPEIALKKIQQSSVRVESTTKEVSQTSITKISDSQRDQKSSTEVSRKGLKRSLDTSNSYHDDAEKKNNEMKRLKPSEENEDVASSDTVRKLKSSVNRPKITSVVSVKNQICLTPLRKKFETYREKTEVNSRYHQSEKRFDKHHYDNNRLQRNRNNFVADNRSRRNRDVDLRYHETNVNDIRNRIDNSKTDRLNKNMDLKEKNNSNLKMEAVKKATLTIKDRLGISSSNKTQRQSIKSQEVLDYKNSKNLEQIRDNANSNKTIKNRLGPLKNSFKPIYKNTDFTISARQSRDNDDDCLDLYTEEELDNEDQPTTNMNTIRSHIVAVNKSVSTNSERKHLKLLEVPLHQYSGYNTKLQVEKLDKKTSGDIDEETDDTKLPSKVIVTPRPLKPLQPTQKRATQSLLLRAVAEANQSVVTRKNPEPKQGVLKRLKPASARDIGQNLSVHLNSNKRLVMEKIQVELNTTVDNMDMEDTEPAPYVPQAITDEHMGVIMSLFQRSDDNQKFLVTLNGYNNNLMKEKISSDDEERLEMEVDEADELALLTTHNDRCVTQEDELENDAFRITNVEDEMCASPKEAIEENNENCNMENVDKIDEGLSRKRRKLSPIIYNRSHSPSPAQLKPNALLSTPTTKLVDKKPLAESSSAPTIVNKSKENCRYWPNCTLGNKCAYLHPPVMCSVFPACKFGDKCAYKHPKCKFGLSCTKLGCMFSHPAQQCVCKYHPFCIKPACPYSHPVTSHVPSPAAEATNQRAKFTWRRRD